MISIVKLLNGTEIVGEVVKEENEFITMSDPLTINYRYKNDFSPPIISLTRFSSFSSSKETTIKREHILAVFVPSENMVKYYNVSLKNIIENIDPAIDQELALAAGDDKDLSPESQAKLALIERHVTKATLN